MVRAAVEPPIPAVPGVGVMVFRMIRRRAAAGFVAGLLACRAASPDPPATLVDDAGRPVVLAAPARRVVSLIPATTELVFALGRGDRLVGRTAWCDWPEAARLVPSLGNGIDPNVEAIVGARPDLVLLYRSATNQPAADRLAAAGIPVMQLATDRLEDFVRDARLVARALGAAAEAERLIGALERELALASRTDSAASRPSVFILAWDRPPLTLGHGSFLSEIVSRAGARNLFGDLASSSAPVSIEAVAARDPDFVLVTGTGVPAFASRPEWQVVRAVRERRFLRVNGSEFNRPSPRMPAAVRQLADSLAARRR